MKRRVLATVGSLVVGAAAIGTTSLAQTGTPLTVVVHGIASGQEDGWSQSTQKSWGVDAVEVSFRYSGRSSSVTDFSRNAGDWAISVRRQLEDIARRNPGRPLVIVSHSWGTVTTKLALMGGVGGGTDPELGANDYEVRPLSGVRIAKWITIGSPLGAVEQAQTPILAAGLPLEVPTGKPDIVGEWVNLADEADPVSGRSHALEGARNNVISGSGWWLDLTGVSAHTGIWTHPQVMAEVRGAAGLAQAAVLTAADTVGRVKSGGRQEDLTVRFSGSPEYPVQLVLRPRTCPENMRCETVTHSASAPDGAGRIVMPGAVWCSGITSVFVFDYEVVMREASGRESNAVPMAAACYP